MQVATALGLNQRSVSEWTTGRTSPGAEFLAQLPALLECNGHWLLTGEGSSELPGKAPDLEAAYARGVEDARAVILRAAERAADALVAPVAATAAIVEAAKATSRALRKRDEEGRGRGKGRKAG